MYWFLFYVGTRTGWKRDGDGKGKTKKRREEQEKKKKMAVHEVMSEEKTNTRALSMRKS